MKRFLYFLSLIFFANCQENFLLVNSKFYPESNTIEYNGKKFVLSSTTTTEKTDKAPISQKSSKVEKEAFNAGISFPQNFWFKLIIFTILACFTCIMSGLTGCYLSIDSLVLELKMKNGTETEKKYAKNIYNLIQNHHLLEVTLILYNTFTYATMLIILSQFVNEMTAIIISFPMLLFIGEIIPKALFTGPKQLQIASIFVPFTSFLIRVSYPISYPISIFMHSIIGEQGKNRFNNSDLQSLMRLEMQEMMMNSNNSNSNNNQGSFLNELANKKIDKLILPVKKVTKINYQEKINKVTIKRLLDRGFSYIPVYKNDPNNLIKILPMKELLLKDLSNSYTLDQLEVRYIKPVVEYEDVSFLNLFEKFQKEGTHMAFIYKKKNHEDDNNQIDNMKQFGTNNSRNEILGIITLDDLFEFMIKKPILDEEEDY